MNAKFARIHNSDGSCNFIFNVISANGNEHKILDQLQDGIMQELYFHCNGDLPDRITDCGGYSIIDVRSACKEIEVCKHISSKEDCMGLLCPLYVPSKEPIIINRACPDSCAGNIPDRWRDVREELPEIGQRVIFIAEAHERLDYLNGMIFIGTYQGDGEFTMPGIGICGVLWMPLDILPPPPSGK